MTDRNDAETMYPNHNNGWRIELRYLPIAHRGHAFLALVQGKGKGEVVEQLHGLSQSRNTNGIVPVGMDGARLFATNAGSMEKDIKTIAAVASGSEEEMKKIWARGVHASEAISNKNYDYKAHDPSYELGTDGGQIQNSNSVAFTLGKAMGLDLDLNRVLREKRMTRTFSGWGRDLLDPKYERYIAPPTFPVRDAP
jgi:hypothetical protein